MANPNIIENQLFDLTDLDVIVRGGFRRVVDGTSYDYCMVREGGGYKSDELAWDENLAGRWKGSPAPLTIPAGLTIDDAFEEPRDYAADRDTILRLESDADIRARWNLNYRTQISGPATFAVKVWDASDGSVVSSATATGTFPYEASTLSAGLESLPDGAYLLGCAISSAAARHMSESEYNALTGLTLKSVYRYTEADVSYFYDYDRNLGVPPSDPEATQNVARAGVLAAGTQMDRAEWIHYATTHEPLASEWALVKFIMGDGDWEASSDLFGPGAVMFRATTGVNPEITTGNRATYAFPFDAMARSLASWYVSRAGVTYVGGDRSTPSGPETALWRLEEDDTATLLATGPKLSTGKCECGGLQDHAVRRIVETHDGTILAQTLCANYRYDPDAATIEQRLAPLPRIADGHPGGRSLISYGRERFWTTEFFGGAIATTTITQFYDTVQRASGEGDAKAGIGTVAHLDGNLALYKGRIRGIVQDKPFSQSGAMQSVAVLTADGWEIVPGMSHFFISDDRLTRVATIGRYFLSYGQNAANQEPVYVVSNGQKIQRADGGFRCRQIDTVLNPSGYETGFAPAFDPDELEDFAASGIGPRRLVETGDPETGFLFEEEAWPYSAANAAEQLTDLPDGSVWFGEPLSVWGENEQAASIGITDVTEGRSFTAYFNNLQGDDIEAVWARIDSDAAVDDLETYIHPAPWLGREWMLPRAAKRKVEIVVLLRNDADPVEPVRVIAIA